MSRYTVSMDTNNAAFDEDKSIEVARILRELADKIENNGFYSYLLRDYNGNPVGKTGYFED